MEAPAVEGAAITGQERVVGWRWRLDRQRFVEWTKIAMVGSGRGGWAEGRAAHRDKLVRGDTNEARRTERSVRLQKGRIKQGESVAAIVVDAVSAIPRRRPHDDVLARFGAKLPSPKPPASPPSALSLRTDPHPRFETPSLIILDSPSQTHAFPLPSSRVLMRLEYRVAANKFTYCAQCAAMLRGASSVLSCDLESQNPHTISKGNATESFKCALVS